MRNYIRRGGLFVVGLLIIIPFQNCTKTAFTSVASTESSESDPAPTGGAAPAAPASNYPPVFPAGSNCAAQNFQWTVAGLTCNANVSALLSGQPNIAISDNDGTTRGSVSVGCNMSGALFASGTPTCTNAAVGGSGSPTPTPTPTPDPAIERPRFIKELWRKSTDPVAYVMTGYNPAYSSAVSYCIQAIGESFCYNSANFVLVTSPHPFVSATTMSVGAFNSFSPPAGFGYIQGELVLAISLATVPPGNYEVLINTTRTGNDPWGWGSNIFNISQRPCFASLIN